MSAKLRRLAGAGVLSAALFVTAGGASAIAATAHNRRADVLRFMSSILTQTHNPEICAKLALKVQFASHLDSLYHG